MPSIKLRRSVTEFPEKNLNFNYLSLFIPAINGEAFIFCNSYIFLNPYSGVWSTGSYLYYKNETLSLSGLISNVTIEIENSSLAKIIASNMHDLMFAQGYYVASQRLFEMELFALVSSGNISSWIGPLGIDSDKAVDLIGLPKNAMMNLNYLKSNYPTIYSYLQAYSDGVNAYINSLSYRDLPLQFKLINRQPFLYSPYYVLTFAQFMAWSLTHGFRDELESAILYAKTNFTMANLLNPIYPYFTNENVTVMPGDDSIGNFGLSSQGISPQYLFSLNWYSNWATGVSDYKALVDIMNKSLNAISDPYFNLIDEGSNSWIITANFSSTHSPILANDPHLTLYAPSLWIYLQLIGGGINVTGWSLVGIPGVLIGHTQHTAWGLTTSFGSSSNAYVEKLNGNYYYYNGSWLPLQSYNYSILGKTYTVYYTKHGPLVYSNGSLGISLYWTANNFPMTTILSEFYFDNSSSFMDLINAAKLWNIPPQNIAIASDKDAGIIDAGLYPLIEEKLPNNKTVYVIGSRAPLNGSTTSFDPVKFVPFEYLPKTINPKRGFAFAPNQPDAWINHPYPFIGSYWVSNGRAYDIYLYMENKTPVSIQDMVKLQTSLFDSWSYMLMPYIKAALNTENMSSLEKQAAETLFNWNYTFSTELVGPTIYSYLISEMVNLSLARVLKPLGLESYTEQSDSIIPSLFLYLAKYEPNSSLFNGSFSNFVKKAFSAAVSFISSKLGNNISNWTWGKVHYIEFYSQLGIPALSLGPYPMYGDSYTLAPGYIPYIIRLPFPYVTLGSSLRMIADIKDGKYYMVFPGGSTENILSPYFSAQVKIWLNLQYLNDTMNRIIAIWYLKP
ncbi:MAG: penicillin acylase family protein [Thermoproteota archaeon]|jgi:Protein related to penicillin acylase